MDLHTHVTMTTIQVRAVLGGLIRMLQNSQGVHVEGFRAVLSDFAPDRSQLLRDDLLPVDLDLGFVRDCPGNHGNVNETGSVGVRQARVIGCVCE